MSEKNISVNGTVQEWQVLINLLDAAVKSVGLTGAKAAVVWAERIQQVANDSQHTKQIEANPTDSGK